MAKLSVSDPDPMDEVLGGAEPAKRITKERPPLTAVPDEAQEDEQPGAEDVEDPEPDAEPTPSEPAVERGGAGSKKRSRSAPRSSRAPAVEIAGESRIMSSRHPESVISGVETLVTELKQMNRRVTKQDVLTALLARVPTLSKAERESIGESALEIRATREGGLR